MADDSYKRDDMGGESTESNPARDVDWGTWAAARDALDKCGQPQCTNQRHCEKEKEAFDISSLSDGKCMSYDKQKQQK